MDFERPQRGNPTPFTIPSLTDANEIIGLSTNGKYLCHLLSCAHLNFPSGLQGMVSLGLLSPPTTLEIFRN
jgi:hypothetical protein